MHTSEKRVFITGDLHRT